MTCRGNFFRFLFVGLDEERSLQTKCGYMRRIACSYFGCCCQRRERWRLIQTKHNDLRAQSLNALSEVDGGIFENLFWTFTCLLFVCRRLVI